MSPANRQHLLMLVALAAVVGAPVPWAAPALAAAAIAVTAVRLGRFVWSRARARQALTAQQTIVLGRDGRGRAIAVSERELSAHGLILGASGAGKTTSLLRILTEQIRRGRPVVALDLKGSPSFAAELAAAAQAAGRPCRVWTLDGPAGWNPLAHGNATELKDKLIATERFTEPHYRRAAERYLLNLLQVAQAVHPDRAVTLHEVVELMEPHRLRASLRGVSPDLGDRVQDYLASMTPDQLSAVRGLQTRLALLTEAHTGQYLGDGAVDIRSALAGDEVVVFSLNSGKYGQMASQLGALVVQDVICAAGDRLHAPAAATPTQATVAIDEFAAVGANNIVALFARARESGISVLLATQEMADLERAGHGLRDQVLGNTALKLAHRQDVPSSAQLIAQMVGTEKRWEESEQVGGFAFAGYGSRRRTRHQAEQFIVHPNEIKTLHTGDAVLISKLRPERAQAVRVATPRREPARREPSPRAGPSRGSGPELG